MVGLTTAPPPPPETGEAAEKQAKRRQQKRGQTENNISLFGASNAHHLNSLATPPSTWRPLCANIKARFGPST